ncbi:hypothetical protein LTR84_011731 [Exophiala bonariae]|uniref:SMODS and SLOG-associating 2TM effector domain-containing protein n=1 Tax=Exophiala bonariae TaxID=1690606 RepID=A0AAV9NGU2_9EURO|nr:hypothetical protein LTR84_011731 [Exophiala bonariae]
MSNERTPLLWNYPSSSSNSNAIAKANENNSIGDLHSQFCMLVGVPSTSIDAPKRVKSPPPKSLYGRASRQLASQRMTYYATASLSNTLLLTQVVLGAALTGLGASESSHILITVFGALNTIIAGVVAYLKSRGQPMRSRMYRDDLERVVDEIENSEIMWLGISRGVHGYDEIDTDENRVTIRSEIARLTRLYDRAVRNNSLNNPDMYMAGAGFDGSNTAMRSRPQQQPAPVPIVAGPAAPTVTAPPVDTPSVPPAVGAVPVSTAPDPDESPASAPPKPKKEEDSKKEEVSSKKDESKDDNASTGESAADGGGNEAAKDKDKKPEPGTATDADSSTTPAPNTDATSSKDAPAPTKPAAPAFDPDASPASSPDVPKRKKDSTSPTP